MNLKYREEEEEKVIDLKFISRSEINLLDKVPITRQIQRKMSNPIDRLRPPVITKNSESRLQTARARFDSDLCKYLLDYWLWVCIAPMDRPDLSNLIDESNQCDQEFGKEFNIKEKLGSVSTNNLIKITHYDITLLQSIPLCRAHQPQFTSVSMSTHGRSLRSRSSNQSINLVKQAWMNTKS